MPKRLQDENLIIKEISTKNNMLNPSLYPFDFQSSIFPALTAMHMDATLSAPCTQLLAWRHQNSVLLKLDDKFGGKNLGY